LSKTTGLKNMYCVKYSPICIFYFRDFHEFSCSLGLLQDFEIFFELNGYYLFTTATWGSVKVKISDNNYFLDFFSNPFAFSYRLVNLRGLTTKVNLNQMQKYFGMSLLGPKPIFYLNSRKNYIQSTLLYNSVSNIVEPFLINL
jgi:hypothetical protein